MDKSMTSLPIDKIHNLLPRWQISLNRIWERWRWLLLALVIVLQCFYAFMGGPAYQHDAGQQNGAVWNLLEGKGVALNTSLNPDDISDVSTYGVTWWPPVKTFLLAPLMGLTGENIWCAAMWLEWVFLAVLFVAYFLLLEAFSESIAPWVRLAIWSAWIFVSAPTSGDTNMMSLACFTLAIALSVWSVRLDRSTLAWGISIGGAMAMSMGLRYAYYPYLIILPLLFAVYGALSQRKAWWRVGLLVAAIGVTTILGIVSYNYAQSGVFLAQVQDETSRVTGQVNWHHLRQFYPFAGDAIGAAIFSYWIPRLNLPLLWSHAMQWAVTLVLCAVQLRFIIPTWLSYLKNRACPHPEAFFWGASVLVHGLTISMLTYMSLRYISEVNGWTQVGDPRYYAPLWPFTVVGVGMMLSQNSFYRVDRFLKGTLVICLVVSLGFGVLNRVGNWRTYARDGIAMGGLRVQDSTLKDFLGQAQAEGLQAVVFVARFSDTPTYAAAEAGLAHASIYSGTWNEGMTLQTTRPTRVFLILSPEYVQATDIRTLIMRDWIDTHKAQLLPQERLQGSVFTFDLQPGAVVR